MKSMELFWKALYDHYKWNQKTQFFLVDINWNEFEQDLSWYFRKTLDEFDSIELSLFENVAWNNLLDIGCATWYYFPYFENKVKNFEWIDISETLIEICKEEWYKNVKVADIINDKVNWKFDIITLMWNNLSIWWNIEWTKKLIWILNQLLSNEWKILSIFKKDEKDYFIWEFKNKYDWILSESFQWIRININYLEELLKEQNFKLKVLSENDYWYCLEIKKDM